jgi:membrane-associated phospholipid phosphatase
VLIDPARIMRLEPPPAPGSAAERAEVAELVGLTRRRDGRAMEQIRFWSEGAVVRWNEIARELVAQYRTDHPNASRVYALLSVGHYDSLVTVWDNKFHFRRPRPGQVASEVSPIGPVPPNPSYPSSHAAVAACSASILSSLYPAKRDWLEARASANQETRLTAGLDFRSDMVAGEAIGRAVAAQVLEHASRDRAHGVWTGRLPNDRGSWTSAPEISPVAAAWGEVRPWLMKAVADYRAPPPPAYDSAAFRAALGEVRRISDTRSSEQSRTAALWADGDGSYAPAGRWNKIGCDLVLKYGPVELRAARLLALLNMAMMDAGIACFETKYHYWVMRPSQADPRITTPVGLPNHPSYTSAHAAFSGAASTVLGGLFPREAASLNARAEEAAISRVYGGIHYRFDGDAGLAQGRAIGELALRRGAQDGSS